MQVATVRGSVVASLVLLCLCTRVAMAEDVSIQIDPATVASAEYRVGDKQLPAILLMHGFLQTKNFSTVSRLADALVDANYTVLVPTLSLGINQRAKSLPCDAIQTHSMEQSLFELEQWVQWLVAKGHTSITLIGHSAGSMLHVAYVSGKPSAAVKNTILISLNYFGQASSAAERDQLETKVKKTISSDAANELSEYKLAFCKKYMARAEDFLSYYRWSRQAVLDALQSVQIPVTVIIGSKDDRMDEDWIATLQAKKVRLKVVQGAGHFFDQAYEFDLLEAVETILEEGE